MSFKSGSISSETSTGNKAYTGIGFEPKAVIFFTQDANAFGDQNLLIWSIGFADGINATANNVTSSVRANQNTSSPNGYARDDACIEARGNDLRASVVSFDADGFTLNWAYVETNSREVSYVAFGGSEITDVEVGILAYVSGSGDHVESLTGSFQPDCVIFTGRENTRTGSGFGAAIGAGVGNQFYMGSRYRDSGRNKGTSWDNERCFIGADDSAVPNVEISMKSLDTGGFTLQKDVGTPACSICYIAIKGGNWAIGDAQSPATATTLAETGVGFLPEGVMFMAAWDDGAVDDDIINKAMAFGVMSATAEAAMHLAANTSDSDSGLVDNKAIRFNDNSGTEIEAADYSSLDSDGFTLSYSAAETATNRIFYLAFDGVAAGGGGLSSVAPLTFGSSAVLSASGDLVASAALAFASSADMKAAGELTGSAALIFGSSAALNASGDMVAAGVLGFGSAAALNAPGYMVAAATVIFGSSADLLPADSNELVAATSLAFGSSAALNAPGEMAAAAALAFAGVADLNAVGQITASAALAWGSSAALSAPGELVAGAALVWTSNAALNAQGEMVASATIAFASLADLQPSTSNDIVATAVISFGGVAALNATGSLAASTTIAWGSSADLLPGVPIVVEPVPHPAPPGAASGTGSAAGTSGDRLRKVQGRVLIEEEAIILATIEAFLEKVA